MKIEVWSKDNCVHCDMTKRWLDAQGISFVEYKIGHDGVTREMLLERVPGARTVPQILINDTLVGGWSDFMKTDLYQSKYNNGSDT